MHLSTVLSLAATASLAVAPASARLDRRSASHRDVAHALLDKREPFRVLVKDGQAPSTGSLAAFNDGIIALKKRDGEEEVLENLGQMVQEVAVAWKLALPEDDAKPIALAATTPSEDAQKKAQEEQAAKEAAAAEEAKKKAEAEAAAKEKAAAAKAKAKAVAAKKAAKEAAEEAAKKAAARKAKLAAKKAAAKKAAEEKAAAEKAAAEKAAAQKAAAQKAAAEKAAAEKAAAEKAAAVKAAAKKAAAEKAAAKKAAEEKEAKEAAAAKKAAAKKVADTSSSSNTKLAVFNPGNTKTLLGYRADNCGPSGATADAPNGALDWLNCGLSKSDPSSPWTPPNGVTLDRITTVTLEHALATNSVWEPCKAFVPLFEKIGEELNVPPIFLASFALQESTCNKDTIGGGGELGLMQITKDKCGGLSQAACMAPEYNIRTAAKYFRGELDTYGGQVLPALGSYNGWSANSMSYRSATAAATSSCCTCQNNLDYLYQFLNGWVTGKTGYELGTYKNLNVCKNNW
ncbi:hypothetical protein JCM10207_004075 [Rhodosporidiobolus poonsookiae]